MLVLSRRVGERLVIGGDIVVTVIEVRSDGVRLGIDAPRSVRVHRAEVLEAWSENAAFWGEPVTVRAPAGPVTGVAQRLGGRIVKVPYDQWWQAIEESRFDGADGLFVHPVQDELVMAGNGTIGVLDAARARGSAAAKTATNNQESSCRE